MEQVECIVIGAGVVGIAVARQLAEQGREVLLLDGESSFGTQTSSRNSEVIHAGIYYPENSLKAYHCVRGRDALYQYCKDRGVPFRQCGKLIVATSEVQRPVLEQLIAHAKAVGVHDLALLSAADVHDLEPAANAIAGILSPSTGIIDSHSFMLTMIGEFESLGGTVAYQTPVLSGHAADGLITLNTGGPDAFSIAAKTVVICCGLGATHLAATIRGLPAHLVPTLYYAKGNYFTYQGKVPFSHLIYPVPEPGGLGIHLTLDLANQARFGPDVEWMEEPDFEVNASRQTAFHEAICHYWPDAEKDRLTPSFAGIRPKITAPGDPAGDFVISGPADHGVQGLYNLFGIESPGLTSSLSLANTIATMASRRTAGQS
ncbi:NAD(P)/FAD-dependent oxidoreductase [Kordiimonas sp.]|uniref:NAD(P)/FAD-dependent oxidoreductase n=1 Tax=Kordiimonas sp. TaxID=1970157 RepID=UPI003B524490